MTSPFILVICQVQGFFLTHFACGMYPDATLLQFCFLFTGNSCSTWVALHQCGETLKLVACADRAS